MNKIDFENLITDIQNNLDTRYGVCKALTKTRNSILYSKIYVGGLDLTNSLGRIEKKFTKLFKDNNQWYWLADPLFTSEQNCHNRFMCLELFKHHMITSGEYKKLNNGNK